MSVNITKNTAIIYLLYAYKKIRNNNRVVYFLIHKLIITNPCFAFDLQVYATYSYTDREKSIKISLADKGSKNG